MPDIITSEVHCSEFNFKRIAYWILRITLVTPKYNIQKCYFS